MQARSLPDAQGVFQSTPPPCHTARSRYALAPAKLQWHSRGPSHQGRAGPPVGAAAPVDHRCCPALAGPASVPGAGQMRPCLPDDQSHQRPIPVSTCPAELPYRSSRQRACCVPPLASRLYNQAVWVTVLGGPIYVSFCEAARAWSRSHRMSSRSSKPTEMRIMSGLMPAAICSSSVNCWCVVLPG
ncbi:hypothetical protein NKDENANG_03502 [Candidatus Entotheonellaceae bacterium PAL068K]